MSFKAMFFDLDDTLYPSTTGIWNAIGDRMDHYITNSLGFAPVDVKKMRNELFYEYGTTLRGLKTLYDIDERAFLDFVHDVPLDRFLQKDIALVDTLSLFPNRKIIFTNASQDHAVRVIEILGIDEFFSEIIDILQISPYCKPMPEAYHKALEIIGLSNPADCVVIDDSPRNLKTASEMGFFTIQVGSDTRCPYADAAILTIADLPDVIPAGMEPQREK